MRRSIATPCPVGDRLNALGGTKDDETTTNLDFTTAFNASFRNVKPKRRRTAINFDIHEDAEADFAEHVKDQGATLVQPAKRSLGHTAQEQNVDQAIRPTFEERKFSTIHSKARRSSAIFAQPKRAKSRVSIMPEVVSEEELDSKDCERTMNISRPARRGTIYVPDDTTMPSMYMGIFSPLKDDDVIPQSSNYTNHAIDINRPAADMVSKRNRRDSTINMPAKRLPLKANSKVQQDNAVSRDQVGAPTGKENMPPGKYDKERFDGSLKSKEQPNAHGLRSLSQSQPPIQSKTFRPRPSNFPASISSNVTEQQQSQTSRKESNFDISSRQRARPVWNGGSRPRLSDTVTVKKDAPRRVSAIFPSQPAPRECLQVPSKFALPRVQEQPVVQHHQILTEHISNPALYEDEWLNHQELAVTQLVNSLFKIARPGDNVKIQPAQLRNELLVLYNQPEIEIVQKRLQAALLYGALSMPSEVIGNVRSLKYDIGRRKNFCDFWLNTYEPRLLEAALEVVTGRQLHPSKSLRSLDAPTSPTAGRKELRLFIENFLIRNEDHVTNQNDLDNSMDSSQRTVLRSLMLLKVLDISKTQIGAIQSLRLFLTNSIFKSSEAALQTLVKMLNPTIGDSVRALRYLGFEVFHEQKPLQEFEYKIKNIAVDLRDGVRLTRLVEVLLYPSASENTKHDDTSETSTIFMPEGETIEVYSAQDWPLSQHLKLPCLGRATRLWNAQIALGALQNVNGIDQLISGVTSEDIVDGFREKTMRLLWALVGRWGLPGLLDWEDVRLEIKRIRTSYDDLETIDVLEQPPGSKLDMNSCQRLLKCWAKAIARNRGVQLHNFTTGFSDGKVFQAILDEYEPFLVTISRHSHGLLHERLLELGCSRQFSELFRNTGQSASHIFSKDFVLAALAFLCSRLVGPSKLCRSAVMIQHAWRQHWARIERSRRMQKQQIARACVEAVKSKTSSVKDRRQTFGDTADAKTDVEDIWLSLRE